MKPGQKLSEWLRERSMKRIDFASRIGVSPAHVTGLCSGATWPSRPVAEAIERETGGDVTANDFTCSVVSADPSPSEDAA